jgi:ribose transport system permease protein
MSASSAAAAFRSRSRWQHRAIQSAPLILALLILMGTLGVYIGLFESELHRLPGNFEWTSLINNSLPLVFVAVGQTVVVITRGLDLSVGGVIALCNTVVASHMHSGTGSMLAWSLIGLAIGAGAGLVNGALVAYGRLQPILVTLATLSIYDGLAIKVLPEPGGAIPLSYTNILTNPLAPWGLVFVGVVILMWLVFRRTPFGVNVFALGNDEQAARAQGVRIRPTKIGAYVFSGMFAAAGGLFYVATTTAGDANSGDSFILTSIASVVLGGISFFGGRGSAIGAVAGAFALTAVVNVLFFAHINPLYQDAFQGLFLVVAVILGALVGRLVRVAR